MKSYFLSKKHFIFFVFISAFSFGQNPDQIHKKIEHQTESIFNNLIEIRNDLNSHPEISGNEKRTSEVIELHLKNLGLEVHTNIGGYGVVGILKTNRKGKKIAWRADIDALPHLSEKKSNYSDAKHLCGHDVNTTIALGIANILAQNKDNLSGTVYFVFQPSEETLKGAKAMIKDNLLSLINPDEIYALHIAPMPDGIIATKPENIFADYKKINITIKNSDLDDVVDFTKNQILKLQNISKDSKFWDNKSLLDPNIGLGNPNTIFKNYITVDSNFKVSKGKKETKITNSISVSNLKLIDSIKKKIKDSFKQSKYANQLIDISFENKVELVINDNKLTSKAIKTLSNIYPNNIIRLHGEIPDGRSDDFSVFQQKIPGVYFLLGASSFEKGIISMPHSPSFSIDENSIKTGVKYFSSLIYERTKA